MHSGGREWRNRDGAGKEQSWSLSWSQLQPDPMGALMQELHHRVVPSLHLMQRAGLLSSHFVVGQSLGVRAAAPPWQLPFSLAQFCIERGNWEISATTPSAAGGWVRRPVKGVWGGTPTGFTADLTLLLSPVPSSGRWGVKLKGTR